MDPDEDDIYAWLLEVLDEGRLPVVCFLGPGLCYYRSFTVEDWSPVMVGDGSTRQECIVTIMRFTHEEGARGAPGR